jgi:NTE family protein
VARPRIGLALGSGGMRGVAHIGVLRALDEAGIRPSLYAGTSIGALLAAAAAIGVPNRTLESLASRWRGPTLFRMDVGQLLRHGRRVGSLYRPEPLQALCTELFGDRTFADIPVPLLVSAVDVDAAAIVWWGVDGTRNVPVADAVYASCAMPGLLPPGRVDGRTYMDGAVVDPLAVGALAPRADVIICVDIGVDLGDVPASGSTRDAFELFARARNLMADQLARECEAAWRGPPLLMIRPRVGHVQLLDGGEPAAVVAAGYRAGRAAIMSWKDRVPAPNGSHRTDVAQLRGHDAA